MVKSDEATTRTVWLKRISKYCKYFDLFSVVVAFHLLYTWTRTHRNLQSL